MIHQQLVAILQGFIFEIQRFIFKVSYDSTLDFRFSAILEWIQDQMEHIINQKIALLPYQMIM